jgi:hypothetical protein
MTLYTEPEDATYEACAKVGAGWNVIDSAYLVNRCTCLCEATVSIRNLCPHYSSGALVMSVTSLLCALPGPVSMLP